MTYKDPEAQRAYQREWLKKRRQKWIDENGPCVRCGSDLVLEMDHIDGTTKVDHKVWSWSDARRNAELAKCQVLCHECHARKDRIVKPLVHGTINAYNKKNCRCDECREDHRKRRQTYRIKARLAQRQRRQV